MARIRLFLRFLSGYFSAHEHEVAIARSVSWSVYKLDDWGIRVEFPVGEEIFVFILVIVLC